MAEVLVVGGGVAGLAAAHEARRRGFEVRVLEAEARAGGVVHSERMDGFLCEEAANGFLDNTPGGAVDLCRALGVELAAANPAAKRRWLWRGDALHRVPAGPAILATRLLSTRAKLRALVEPLVRSKAEGDESLSAFVRRRLGAEVADVFVQPLVTGIWAGDAERLSAAAAFPKVVELERRYGSLVRGLIASRKNGARPMGGMLAPIGGTGALVDALSRELGSRVETGARAEALEKAGRGFRLRLAGGATLEAERLVLACPPQAAGKILRPHDDALADLLADTPYVGVAVVHVGIDAGRVRHPLDGFGFLVCPGETLRCLGCVFESSLWPARAPEGRALLRLIYGGSRDPEAPSLSDEALQAAALADLGRSVGVSGTPSLVRVVRHARAIPQYVVGHLARVEEIERRAAALGVVLAGSGYHGVSVNDCVKDAQRVAERLGPPEQP